MVSKKFGYICLADPLRKRLTWIPGIQTINTMGLIYPPLFTVQDHVHWVPKPPFCKQPNPLGQEVSHPLWKDFSDSLPWWRCSFRAAFAGGGFHRSWE